MSISQSRYYGEVAKHIASPSKSCNIVSPYGRGGRIMRSIGSVQTVTLSDGVDGVLAVFDPEATLRTGQIRIEVHERTSGVTTMVRNISVGSASTENHAARLFSSYFLMSNGSSLDDSSSSITAGIVRALPSLMTGIDADLLHTITDDVDTTCAPGTGVSSFAVSDYRGDDLCFLEKANASAPLIYEGADAGISNWSSGTDTDADALIGTAMLSDTFASAQTVFDLIGVSVAAYYDTAIESSSQFTSSTYACDVHLHLNAHTTEVIDSLNQLIVWVLAADSAGSLISYERSVLTFSHGDLAHATIDSAIRLKTTSSAIARVYIVPYGNSLALSSTKSVSIRTYRCRIDGVSRTSGIAGRPVHIAVAEGVNSNARLILSASALLDTLPSSTLISSSTIGGRRPGVDRGRISAIIDDIDATQRATRVGNPREIGPVV